MMLKHHHLLHNFMSRMSRSHNIEQASLQKLILSSLHQTRIKKLYVNSPIPKLSSQEVASLVRSKRELRYARITGGTEERSGGTEEKTGTTKERTGGTKDNYKQWNSPIPKLSSKKVASFVRVQRDLSRLSRRSGGTEEGSGGTEERTGGTVERTGGTEDSYKQWRKMG